ncbi:MAG: DNA repair protein RecO [Propionibacteriaceae bacterium]|nr:DNA repair protein RecO [Propionibacteriaceae bacterium]
MRTYRTEAVVLHTWKLGEADRIISLFTREYGKVRAVAKGVRRSGSKFGARLELFSHVDVQLVEGRGSLDTITQVESLHPPMLGSDYDRFCAAQVLVEAADRIVSEDRSPSLSQYRLLLGALIALGRGQLPAMAVVDSYLLRALAAAGWATTVQACVSCGDTEDLRWFSPQLGGAVCPTCRAQGSASASPELLALIGALLAGDWDHVCAVAPNLRSRAHGIVGAFAGWHLDRSLRSLPFLEGSAL